MAQSDDDALLDEQLSAYLDGELDPATSREIEQRLARDEQARSHLQALEQAWSLLDQLPQAELTEAFTHGTVELITVRENEAANAGRSRWTGRRGAMFAGAAAGVALAALLGFGATRRWLGRHDERLLRDLPVIEQLDAYRQLDDVEFLRELRRAELFTTREVPRGS